MPIYILFMRYQQPHKVNGLTQLFLILCTCETVNDGEGSGIGARLSFFLISISSSRSNYMDEDIILSAFIKERQWLPDSFIIHNLFSPLSFL